MQALLSSTELLVATVFATAIAACMTWLLLQAMFQLMRPAAARHPQPVRSELVHGTRELLRHWAPQR